MTTDTPKCDELRKAVNARWINNHGSIEYWRDLAQSTFELARKIERALRRERESAEPVAIVANDGYGNVIQWNLPPEFHSWPVGTKLYTHPPATQPAEPVDMTGDDTPRADALRARFGGHYSTAQPKHLVRRGMRADGTFPPADDDEQPTQTAKQKYDQFMKPGEEPDPVERLRFFCSIAMSGQDWLDSEPFFDALVAAQEEAEEVAAHTHVMMREVVERAEVLESRLTAVFEETQERCIGAAVDALKNPGYSGARNKAIRAIRALEQEGHHE